MAKTQQTWQERFDAKQKARRISGMTTFDDEDLKINDSPIPNKAQPDTARHEDAAYWRKRTDEYSLQLANTHNHADKLAEALQDLISEVKHYKATGSKQFLEGAITDSEARLAAWEKANQ